MRPPKQILYVDSDETELPVMAFVLRTRGYAVTTATNAAEAIERFAAREFDVVVVQAALVASEVLASEALVASDHLIHALKQANPFVPVIMIASYELLSGGILFSADTVLDKKTVRPEELVDRVRVMCARKRGPRPGTQSREASDE